MKKKVIIAIITVAIIALIATVVTIKVIPNSFEKEYAVSDTAYVTSVKEIVDGSSISFSSNRFGGIVEIDDVIEVTADSSKTIKTTYVKEGDTIKKGDKLFEYDVDEMKLELEQSKLKLDEVKAEITLHNSRISSLEKEKSKTTNSDEKLSIENEISSEKLDLKRAEYGVKSTEKEIEKLELSIKNNVIKAEKSGIVKSIGYASQSSLMSMNTTDMNDVYITIATNNDYRIKANVSEGNIGSFSKDTNVIIRSRSDEKIMWSGKVKSVENSQSDTTALTEQNNIEKSTKYVVYISIDNPEGMMVGQHVTVEKGVFFKKDGLWIEQYYINDVETAPYVWCLGGSGTLEKRSVTLGDYDEETDKYEIKSGISQEDYIAYPEEHFTEGMSVEKSEMYSN